MLDRWERVVKAVQDQILLEVLREGNEHIRYEIDLLFKEELNIERWERIVGLVLREIHQDHMRSILGRFKKAAGSDGVNQARLETLNQSSKLQALQHHKHKPSRKGPSRSTSIIAGSFEEAVGGVNIFSFANAIEENVEGELAFVTTMFGKREE